MSNDWSAPTPSGNVPPADGVPPVDPSEAASIDLEPVGQQPGASKRSPAKAVAIIATVLAVGAAGAFAISRVAGGGDEPTGAESPEALGELTLDAFEQTDVLGAIDLLLPSERETYGEPLIELIDELERIEVLSEVDLSDVNGVDIELTDRGVSVEETTADDIVHVNLTANGTATVAADELPTGPILEENDIEGEDSETTEPEPFDIPLVGVERDGKWYLSMMYTVAETARLDTYDEETGEPPAIPAEGITPHGADTPEGALDLLATAAEDLDLEALIAAINPDEAEALQRYAPLFVDDAESALDDVDSTVEFTELDTRVEGGGDRRHVMIENLGVKIESQGEQVEILWADGCLKAEANGESVDFCELEESVGIDTDEILDEFYADLENPEPVKEFIETFTAAFADYEEPGIAVAEVDGEWYVSPVATGTDHVLALFAAVDSDELRNLIELGQEAFETLEDEDTIEITD